MKKYVPMLLALNCLVFAAYAAPHAGDLPALMGLAMGAEPAGMPVSIGDMWPGIASYMFGHAGLVHLGSNMAMLLLVGWRLEERAGARVVLYYLAGGFAGAVAHMTLLGLAGQDAPLIGASAAVSALLGAAIFHRTVNVGTIVYFVLALNVFPLLVESFGILPDTGVSFVAHLGGAVMGMVLGAGFAIAGRLNARRLRRAGSREERHAEGRARRPDSGEYHRAPVGRTEERPVPSGRSYANPSYHEM